jgi:uncharacterized protein (TIGR03083 family)
VEYSEFVRSIRANGASLANAARRTASDAPVPACPPWTMHELVGHLAGHYDWVSHNLDRAPGAEMFPLSELPAMPSGPGAIDALEANALAVAGKLDDLGPAHACWTWIDDRTSAFWARRAAHESAIHMWDGLDATGESVTFPPDVAADGIDEYLTVVTPGFWADGPPVGPGERIQLMATDAPADWHLHVGAKGTVVRRERHPGDVVVTGTASALWLVLMGRLPTDRVTVSGDSSVLLRWHEQTRF